MGAAVHAEIPAPARVAADAAETLPLRVAARANLTVKVGVEVVAAEAAAGLDKA